MAQDYDVPELQELFAARLTELMNLCEDVADYPEELVKSVLESLPPEELERGNLALDQALALVLQMRSGFLDA